MGKFNYITKVSTEDSISKMEYNICEGLDEKHPYIHSRNIANELFTREQYYLEGNKHYLNDRIGQDLMNLNDHINSGRSNQAKFILYEVGKLTHQENLVMNSIAAAGTLTGEDFKNIFEQVAYTKDGSVTKLVDEYKIKEIFKQSEEIEPTFTEEELVRSSSIYEETKAEEEKEEFIKEAKKADEELIEFNTNPKNQEYFEKIDDLAATNSIKALGFDRKEIDDSLNTIRNADDPNKEVVTQFKKLISNHMDKIPTEAKSEGKFVEESEKLYNIFKFYGRDKLGENYMPTIKDYVSQPEYRDFAISCTATRGCAGILRSRMEEFDDTPHLKNVNFDHLINAMKHVQQVHDSRSWWSRFKDWFNPNGEYRTLNNCKKFLKERDYTDEQIEEALDNANGELSDYQDMTIDEHINVDSKAEYFTKDIDINTVSVATDNLDAINMTNENLQNLKGLNEKYGLNIEELDNLEIAPKAEEIEEVEDDHILSENIVPMDDIERDSSIDEDEIDDDEPDFSDDEEVEPTLGDE